MARTVTTSSTFENWRQNYNDLATDVGDPTTLTTGTKKQRLDTLGRLDYLMMYYLKNETKMTYVRATKVIEEKFLKKSLNEIINMASKEEKINPTMLLSKKNQDIFLNNVIRDGLDNSIQGLSKWRRKILSDKILSMKSFIKFYQQWNYL